MAKKSFFDERTVPAIKRLKMRKAGTQRGLVNRIVGLDPGEEALEISCQIVPGRFHQKGATGAEAARKAYKHGNYLALSHGRTKTEALQDERLPHEIRREDFDELLGGMKEQEVNHLGYSFKPVQGSDKVKRLVPFAWILEGTKLFTYASQNTGGISVKRYDDAARVELEGTNVMTTVPARGAKKSRYNIRVGGVPVFDVESKNAIWTTFSTTYSEGKMPEHNMWTFGYKFKDDAEQSRSLILYPHDVAAELGVTASYLVNEHNTVPWDMNPFAKPSEFAADFYRKLSNNVIVRDPSIKRKDGLRKPNIAERSILLARLVSKHGHDETMFWQAGRDARLSDYDWSIPGSD